MTNSQTDQITFPFLSLAPEVRNSVYKYSLLSRPLRHGTGKIEKWWAVLGLFADPDLSKKPGPPCINLLLANRQIYDEACHILYYHGRFLIPYFTFNKPYFRSTASDDLLTTEHAEIKNFACLAARKDSKFNQIRNLEIEINWVRAHSKRGLSIVRKGGMSGVCQDLHLSNFQHLRTITVSWQSYSADPARPGTRVHKMPLHNCEETELVLYILQSFKTFQISQPSVIVMIRMPSAKPVITTNTKEQGTYKGLLEFMNELEDIVQQENAKHEAKSSL